MDNTYIKKPLFATLVFIILLPACGPKCPDPNTLFEKLIPDHLRVDHLRQKKDPSYKEKCLRLAEDIYRPYDGCRYINSKGENILIDYEQRKKRCSSY